MMVGSLTVKLIMDWAAGRYEAGCQLIPPAPSLIGKGSQSIGGAKPVFNTPGIKWPLSQEMGRGPVDTLQRLCYLRSTGTLLPHSLICWKELEGRSQ